MSSKPLSFQDVIMRLQAYWAEQGCLIWQPYSEKVGAGTANPATVLRVLGPEPWNVAYVEPSYRPDDGRYAENPNRMQMHTQYQVILKPDPGESAGALPGQPGGDRHRPPQARHPLRRGQLGVARRWARGAWAGKSGWTGWRSRSSPTSSRPGGFPLDPVSVEITYGLERIVMYLQGVNEVWQIDWDGGRTYGDVLQARRRSSTASTTSRWPTSTGCKQMYDLFEAEAKSCLAQRAGHPGARLRPALLAHLQPARRARRHRRDRARALLRAHARPGAAGLRGVRRAAAARRSIPGSTDGERRWRRDRRPQRSRCRSRSCASKPPPFLLEIGIEELPPGDLVDAHRPAEDQRARSCWTSCGWRMAECSVDGHAAAAGRSRRRPGAARRPNEESLVKGPPAERGLRRVRRSDPGRRGLRAARRRPGRVARGAAGGQRRYVYAVVRSAGPADGRGAAELRCPG